MTSFQEFLHKKAEEQGQSARRLQRDEWISAVSRLTDQITAWLGEANTEGILDLIDVPFDKVEAGLGPYTIYGLKIGLGDLSVQVVPVWLERSSAPLESGRMGHRVRAEWTSRTGSRSTSSVGSSKMGPRPGKSWTSNSAPHPSTGLASS
jgi:hypothetical protein